MNNPVSPTDVIRGRSSAAHPDVVEVINSLLFRVAHVVDSSVSATLRQDEVVAGLVSRGHSREDIFANHLLDFEAAFRAAGWVVVYEKPGFNESGEPSWRFSRK